jgi:hypothetical protein
VSPLQTQLIANADAWLGTVPVFFGEKYMVRVSDGQYLSLTCDKNKMKYSAKELQAYETKTAPPVPPYGIKWQDREAAQLAYENSEIYLVDFWNRERDEAVPSDLLAQLEYTMTREQLASLRPVRFQFPPVMDKPGGDPDYLPRAIRRKFLDAVMVLEKINVYPPRKLGQLASVHFEARCMCCGRAALAAVELADGFDIEEIARLDWLGEFIEHKSESTYEPAEPQQYGTHLCERMHWYYWENYGAGLNSILGWSSGLGMRHMSKYVNRNPFELMLDEMLWAPNCKEGCPLPSKESVSRHLGEVRLLLPAAYELVESGKVVVRDLVGEPGYMKVQWRPMVGADVAQYHVGLIYFSSGAITNDVYDKPYVRYIRHPVWFELPMAYFDKVVRVLPSDSEPRPDLAKHKAMMARDANQSDLQAGDITIGMMPPGSDYAWYAVVEIELTPRARARLGLKDKIVLICMVQIATGEWVTTGDVYVFPAWALRGTRDGMSRRVVEAVQRAMGNWEEFAQFRLQ